MANNNDGQIVLGLDIPKTVSQINADIKKLEKQLEQVKATGALDTSATVQKINSQIAKLQAQLKTIDIKANVDTKNVQKTGEQIGNNIAQGVSKGVDKATKQLNKIQLSFDNGHGDSDYQNRITAITNELTKYGLSVDEVNQKTENLRTILNGFKIDGNFLPDEQLVAQANKLEAEFKAVKVSVDSAKLSYDKFLQPVSNEKASSLIVRINSFLTKNTAITSEAKAELQSFVAQLNNGVNLGEWNKFNSRLKEIEVKMRQAGKLGKSLTQTFKDSAKSFIEWSTASGAVMEVVQAVKVAIDNVKELDDQLLELSKVSDLSAGGLVKVTEEAYELGDTVGKTGTQVLEAITTFKRAGFELENSTDLAEIALKMVNVAEGIDDASEAAQYLISIMKGYGDTSTEFATKILDSVNEVSNTQSVDFDNLVDGGQRLSAVANQAGVSFDQMLGVLTGGYEVLGNMEKTASGLITIFTRLQSIQLADEEEVQSVAKLQETFSEATNGKVNIVDQTTGQLRGAYDILNDLNEVWNELDKNTQEGLAFAAGGTRQKSVFLSIMSNWNSVEKSVDSATESFGSAEEENSKYLESLSGKITIFESAVEKLSNTVLNSGLLGFFVDLGTFGVNSIDGLINSFGGLTSILGAGTGIALNKILGYLQRYTYQKSKWFCEAQLHIS